MRRNENKNKKTKAFHKKSIWPSILLFLLYIVFCVQLLVGLVNFFEKYIIDSKLAALYDNAGHLEHLLTDRLRENAMEDAVSALKRELRAGNDICLTDEAGNILLHFGDTTPDLEREEMVGILDTYRIYPDVGVQERNWDGMLLIPIGELLQRTMEAPPDREFRQNEHWLEEIIFSANCWMEIQVKAEGYRLYFKDAVTLAREDIIYMLIVGGIALLVLTVPIILLFINVLSSIAMQKRMVKLLYLDPTTGGKNWVHFIHESQKILGRIRNLRCTYALINIHMDRYQDYCACYGSKAGEELLKNIDGFLQAKTGRGETFARFARADYGLLFRCDSMEQCERRLKKLLAELMGMKQDRKLRYCAGVYGIAPVTDQRDYGLQKRRQTDVEQLYHYASAARVSLKGKGEHIKVFDQQILDEQIWKHKVEDTMEMALLNKEFQIYLQPKYNPVSGRIVSAEALVRWLSPTEGLISPGRFIPVFEENGFITQLDDYMISSVAKLQSEWKIQGRRQIPVSVNVSRVNFTKENLAEHICQLVDDYGAEHGSIELELTESAFFGDKAMLGKLVKELKMYGFPISMDDFGSGYSSLNSLKDLPIDVLKLDMDFFKESSEEKRAQIVVKEIIQLAKNLDMKIVAEGIERKEQVDFLAEQGCDMIQGFYFAKPMTVSEFNQRVEQEAWKE